MQKLLIPSKLNRNYITVLRAFFSKPNRSTLISLQFHQFINNFV